MDVSEALAELLPAEVEADTMEGALMTALQEAWRRRRVNTDAGGAVIRALLERGWTYRRIEETCGIPLGTANRWARRPEEEQR